MRTVTLLALSAALAMPAAALAAGKSPAPSFTLDTTTYSQDFDTLATTGTSQSLPAGFQIVELGTGSNADGFYAAGTGSSNSGNIYSFGASGSSERALGSLGSGAVAPNFFGGIFTNGLGGTISSLAFGYTGEQWRAGNSTDDMLNFQYSLDASQLDNGSWIDIDSLDFLPLVLGGNTPLNGNLPGNQRALTGTVAGLSIANGASFGFRWVDANSGANDHGLGVDNLLITSTFEPVAVIPEPATWAMLLVGFGAIGMVVRRRRGGLALAKAQAA